MTRTGGRPRFLPRLFRTVGSKLAGVTIAVLLMVTAGLYLQISRYQRDSLLAAKETAAAAVARLFTDSCAAPVIFEDKQAINDTLATLGHNDEVEYAALWSLDPTGRQVAAQLGELTRGPTEPPPEFAKAMRLQRRSDRVVISSPVYGVEGKPVAMAVAAFSLARENHAIARLRRTTLIVSAAVAVGLMAVLIAMARLLIVGPLGKLVVAAKDIKEGRHTTLDVHSEDEVGHLAREFRDMAAAINVREQHIKARNADMRLLLENVGQGFVTLDIEGRMSAERSRVVEQWFGAPDGTPLFCDYLRAIDSGVGDYLELGWMQLRDDLLPIDVCLAQLPAQVREGDKTFELAYRPVLEGDSLAKVIVVITDATVRMERERAEQGQRVMMIIFRRMLADRTALDELLTELAVLVDGITGSDGSDLALLRRQVHTLKGNCALIGFDSVSELCHDIETRLNDSRGPLSAEDRMVLTDRWTEVQGMRAHLAAARPEGAIELDPDEHAAFLTDLRGVVDRDALASTAASWRFESASKRLATIAEQLRALVRRLDHAEVDVVCSPTNLRLPPRRWASFWAAFAHVVRNTADHGVETTEARVAAGKPPRATITLAIARSGQQVTVTVADDGPGIDWERITLKAEQMGLPHGTPAEIEEALFAEGVSSRSTVGGTSGRGVGLGAVHRLVTDLGGRIEIRSQRGHGAAFVFVLPSSLLDDIDENDVGVGGELGGRRDLARAPHPASRALS